MRACAPALAAAHGGPVAWAPGFAVLLATPDGKNDRW